MDQRTTVIFSAEDRKMIQQIKKMLKGERGEKATTISALRYALRQTTKEPKK